MTKFYYCLLTTFLMTSYISAQEVINISGYDGTGSSVPTTATVNDQITIVFEDVNIINNFYTENQTVIYLYGGLQTSAGGFQDAPLDFNDLSSQPQLTLTAGDGDAANGPNTYSITFNLALEYDGVADGTNVIGFNLLFQNQFGGGGNNQTADLFIDLADAAKDSSSLSVENLEVDSNNLTSYIENNILNLKSNANISEVSIYNILGQNIFSSSYNNTNETSINMASRKAGVYIAKVRLDNKTKTIKFIIN